jgi:glycosyltransferase involved in cell wall biosynthesis
VVADFQRVLPGATVFVYDNGSTDGTPKVAEAAGAIVRHQPLRGKGNVVRQMFADIEADVYVLVDGDDTYDADVAPQLIDKLVNESLDMVNGARVTDSRGAYRPGHRLGNQLLSGTVAWFFGNRLGDLLSGYRVFSRRFVKSFPALSGGFEIETEFTVHALQLRMPIAELPTNYRDRPAGTASKLSTYRDGWRILRTIAFLVKEERPLAFFSTLAIVLMLASLGFGFSVVVEYLETGLVPRAPTALLASALMILSFLSMTCGLILDSVTRGRVEAKRLAYLGVPIRFRDHRP